MLNNTKVLPARFYAQRTTGAALQGLFLEEAQPHEWLVMLKNARKIKVGESIHLLDRNEGRFCTARAIERFEEDLTDQVRVHHSRRVVIEVDEAIEVSPQRDRTQKVDPLMSELERRLSTALDRLANRSRPYVASELSLSADPRTPPG